MKHPEREVLLEGTYDEMDSDLSHRIEVQLNADIDSILKNGTLPE